jgi:hypothetical protein
MGNPSINLGNFHQTMFDHPQIPMLNWENADKPVDLGKK